VDGRKVNLSVYWPILSDDTTRNRRTPSELFAVEEGAGQEPTAGKLHGLWAHAEIRSLCVYLTRFLEDRLLQLMRNTELLATQSPHPSIKCISGKNTLGIHWNLKDDNITTSEGWNLNSAHQCVEQIHKI
jgi:hypothetical protein